MDINQKDLIICQKSNTENNKPDLKIEINSDINLEKNKNIEILTPDIPVCLYFLKGDCDFGDDCDFAHVSDQKMSKETQTEIPQCRFFRYGNCKYGDKCIYNHTIKKFNKENRTINQTPPPNDLKNNPYNKRKNTNPNKKKVKPKSKLQICGTCDAFFFDTCAFCENIKQSEHLE